MTTAATGPLPATYLADLHCIVQWIHAPSGQQLIDAAEFEVGEDVSGRLHAIRRQRDRGSGPDV